MSEDKKDIKLSKLTVKQRRFCELYVQSNNAYRAYLQAYHEGIEVIASRNSRKVKASRLLKQPNLSNEVKRLRGELSAKTELDSKEIIRNLQHILNVDVRDFLNEYGDIQDISEVPESMGKAISSFEFAEKQDALGNTVKYLKKVKFHDKNAASAHLMRYLGMFEKDNNQVSNTATVVLLPAKENHENDSNDNEVL